MPRVALDRAIFGEGRWLAEFRKLTIVYIQLSDISLDACLLTKLQSAIFAIQTISARFEGTILNVLMDDKGISAILVFGLPPFGHSDDALRAIQSAGAVRRDLASHNMQVSIGIATGRLFCGEYEGRRVANTRFWVRQSICPRD